MSNLYGDRLYHHGILGQKWGKQNGPPYPLDANDHSVSEKKIGWRKSLNGKKNPEMYDRKDTKEDDKKFKLTDKQKKAIKIGAALVGTALVAYGGYQLYKNKDYIQQYVKLGKQNVDFIRNSGKFDYLDKAFDVKDINIADPENKLGRSNLLGKVSEALKDVNPSNEKDHCQQNALAACFKYMGSGNIQTKPGEYSMTPGSVVDKVFKGSTEKKIIESRTKIINTVDDASNFILRHCKPIEGSCGTISMNLKNSETGHAIMWYMENNSIKYADPWARTPNGHRIVEDASVYFGNLYSNTGLTVSRVDDKEINYEGLEKLFNIVK